MSREVFIELLDENHNFSSSTMGKTNRIPIKFCYKPRKMMTSKILDNSN